MAGRRRTRKRAKGCVREGITPLLWRKGLENKKGELKTLFVFTVIPKSIFVEELVEVGPISCPFRQRVFWTCTNLTSDTEVFLRCLRKLRCHTLAKRIPFGLEYR